MRSSSQLILDCRQAVSALLRVVHGDAPGGDVLRRGRIWATGLPTRWLFLLVISNTMNQLNDSAGRAAYNIGWVMQHYGVADNLLRPHKAHANITARNQP